MEPSHKTIEMVFGFPRKGEVYGTFDVLDSTVDPKKQTWSVTFAEEVQRKFAIEALRTFVGKQAIFSIEDIDYSVEFPSKPVNVETIRDNPPGAVQTKVSGTYSVNGAFQNPISVEDFNADMDKMTVSNPKKHFRTYPAGELHSKKFRDQLFKFVTRRGESYGWVSKGEIFHRKGSLIMPYVKINKHIENSVISYHTHPSKDEPSLTSPDDIQWYMDAAYKWGIRHFYTIMKDRLDHFEFVIKGDNGRKRYLKMDEGKFVDDLGTMLDKIEKEYKDKEDLNDYQFCERVTRAWIKEINSKFSHLVDIKYHHHIRPGAPKLKPVLENPGSDTPFPHTTKIKVNDKYLSIALNELKGIDYDWIHYGGDEFSHTMYVYWWLKYHFMPKADGTDRLWLWETKGLDAESRKQLRTYLDAEIEDGWTYGDCLLMFGLFHDIAKKREKEQKIHHSIIGADMFKDEIAPELKLPNNLTERMYLMLQSDVGRKRITEEEFFTIAGDLYPVAKIFHMSDRVAHHPYMYTIAARMARKEGVLKTGEYGDAYIEMANKHDILELVKYFREQPRQNPPPKMPTTATYSASYDIAIDPDTAEFLFQDYDPRKVPGNDGKTTGSFMASYRQMLYLKMVLSDGYVASASLSFKYPGNLNITGVPIRDDFGLSGAKEVYERVGQVLQQAYDIDVDFGESKEVLPETFDIVPASDEDYAVQPLTNPKPQGETIVLAGAHGSGRREIAKELYSYGYMLCPMHTTEPRKPGRIPNQDSVNHSQESFNQEIIQGNMKYWTIGSDGHRYGYTKDQLNCPKSVMYTTPHMAMKMKESMPKIVIVFVDNKDSIKRHQNRLSERNGVTQSMAKATAKRKHTLRNARHNFDKVVNVQNNNHKKAAITLINPHGGAHRVPKKYEGQPMDEHSDLYTDEDPKGTIQGLGFKDKTTAEKSIRLIENSGKTHAHKIQAAMAMEQRARFHPHQTTGIKQAQKVYARFIKEMKKKTKRNPGTSFSDIKQDFEQMIDDAFNVRMKEVTGEDLTFNGREWWNQQIPLIEEKYGTEPTKFEWLRPIEDPDFDPTDKSIEFESDGSVKPIHFFNQLMRIPMTKEPTPERIMQVALNIGQGLASGSVDIRYSFDDFLTLNKDRISKDNPSENLTPTPKEIREALDIFGEQEGLDANKAMLIAGAALYMHGLKPIMNDVDAIIPGKPDISEGYVNGLELDIGGGPDFTAEMLDYKVKEGVRYQSLSAILAFYKMLNREKDQVWIEKLSKTLNNPSKTPEGRKIPKKYLKGLNKEEMAIAAKEIDKGYKYDIDDPEAYKEWKSDIKAKARGYKTVPSKYKKKFIQMYGPLPEKGDFLTKISKATGVKKSILKEVEKKGLAAWRTGHRVGANQHAWARGRVYSFVTLGNTVKMGNKRMGDYKLAVKAGLIKENPSGNFFPGEAVKKYPWLRHADLIKQNPTEYPDSVKESEIVLERMKNPDFEFFELTDLTPVSGFTQYLKEQKLDFDEEMLLQIARDSTPFILQLKNHYNRPRPAEVNKKIKPAKSLTANTRAYPSGHALQSYLLANYLTRLHPSHGKKFQQIADRISESRVSVGLHYPSDNAKSKELVDTHTFRQEYTVRKIHGPLPNPSKQPKASFNWFEKFTAWVELVNMKNKELKAFLESDPWGKKAGINRQQAKDFGGISRGRFSASRILIMRKKLGLTGPKDYIKAGPIIIRNYYELAQKKWSEADWEWCKKQVSFNSRTRGQRGPYTDSKGRPTRKLTSLWVWGHDPWRYARKIEKRKTMPKCPNVPWIGQTEKRMYGTTEYKYPEVENNPPFRRRRLYHGSSVNNLKVLKPNHNATLGREVVFATPNYEYALAMSIPSTNDDFDIGYVNGEFTIEEQYEGAFNLLKQPAYMYEVDEAGFREHPEFPPMERIIEVTVPVRKVKRISNVYHELRRVGANLIPYW